MGRGRSVKSTKSYLINLLDKELTEYKWADLKAKGVGQTTLLKFLGGIGRRFSNIFVRKSPVKDIFEGIKETVFLISIIG